MIKDKLFVGLFPLPYNHEKWLSDQAILIERMNKTDDPFIKEQAKKLEAFQKAKQASIMMLDIVVDRIARHENGEDTDRILADRQDVVGEMGA